MLRRDAHLRHLRKRQLLADQRPLGQKIFDLLFDCGSARRDGIEQQRVWPVGGQEFPRLRRQREIARGEPLGKILGILFQPLPALDKAFVNDLLLHRRNFLVWKFAREKVHYDRAGVGVQSQFLHLLLDLE